MDPVNSASTHSGKVLFMASPMIALPGTMCAPAIFDPLAEVLRPEVHVDAFSWMTQPGPWDIPSVATNVANHIRRSYDRPVLVAGHSTGGAIALQLTLDAPELVQGLVLVGTGAHMRGHGDVSAILERITHGWDERLWADVLDRSFRIAPSPQQRRDFIDWVRGVDKRAAYDVLASQRDLDLSAELANITIPSGVIIGRHDPTRTVAQAREFADHFVNATFTVLETGHTPVFEAPEEVADCIRGLLSE